MTQSIAVHNQTFTFTITLMDNITVNILAAQAIIQLIIHVVLLVQLLPKKCFIPFYGHASLLLFCALEVLFSASLCASGLQIDEISICTK